jgi:hypothetical protein
MPIWRLTPIDLRDPNWEASSHRGLVVVRAPSEGSAREAAEEAFGVPTRFPPGKGMRVPPWTRPELVHAEIIDSPLYAAEGPTEVLEPSFTEAS